MDAILSRESAADGAFVKGNIDVRRSWIRRWNERLHLSNIPLKPRR
jgi:hypothetical protein